MTLQDLRPGLRAYLLADSNISSIVGGARVYAIKLPQGETRASIVYSKISGIGDYHLQGPSGLARPRIQIDCWAPDADGIAGPDASAALGRLVKERIDGFRGSMPYGSDSPQASVEVLAAFLDSEREDYDDTAKLYRTSLDYLIWFRER